MAWNITKTAASNEQLSKHIKQSLSDSVPIQKLFAQFGVSFDRLKDLNIEIVPLDHKYAETDADTMKLNETMFRNGWEGFIENYFFVVAHEIVHWLSRVREQDSYFNDPEEVLGFVASIAYEMSLGHDLDIIWNRIYPKVSFHFNNEKDAREFFKNMTHKARDLLNSN